MFKTRMQSSGALPTSPAVCVNRGGTNPWYGDLLSMWLRGAWWEAARGMLVGRGWSCLLEPYMPLLILP